MTTKQSSQPRPFSDTVASLLPSTELLSLPRLPTIKEMAEEDLCLQQTTPPRKMNDLFDGILGTLDPLLADYLEHPEKYGEETHELLEQLTRGSTSLEQLSANERRLLNVATFDFAQAPKPVVKLAKKKEPVEDDELELEGAEAERPGSTSGEVPVTELPAFWWLRV